ncbi:helix-turn-helix domain-containing protein [Singulisphaera rosea]
MSNATATSRYLELVREFPIRLIRSDEELREFIARINSLMPIGDDVPELTPDEDDYIEALGAMVERYEAEHDPIPEMSGVDMLKFLLAENELSLRTLADQTGIPFTTLGSITAGTRRISPRVREALAKRFKMHPTAFV